MENRPFFTVTVPVYNQENNLQLSFGSLQNQGFRDFEVIYVDDGSTDRSFEQLQAFAARDSRIRIVRHGENKSLLTARFTGMKHACGEYILFLDSDDFLSNDALQCVHDSLAEKPVDILRFGYVTEPQGTETRPIPAEDPLKSCLSGELTPSIWKNCYSRRVITSLLCKAEPFYCNMSEDACLSGMLFSCAESFGVLDRCLYHYNAGGMSSQGANLSLAKMERDLRSVDAAGEHLVAFLQQNDPDYGDLARRAADRMIRFVFFQHIVYDESWDAVLAYLRYVKDGKYSRFFHMACNKLIPVRVKVMLGIKLTWKDREDIFDI